MEKNKLIKLATQLAKEHKELLAITDKYILVKWYADMSYVSWEYYYKEDTHEYVFEVGHYMRLENASDKEALTAFAERI